MFTTMTADRSARIALPGATDIQAASVTRVNGTEAHDLAAAGELRCEEIHCDAPIFFRSPPNCRPHWYHAAGTANDCATTGGSAGEFHRYLQYDVFGPAFAHEFSVPGARADAIVQRIGSKKNVAIEIQHSPIAKETVLRRHAAHQTAGIMGTVWVINSADIARDGTIILTQWVIDLFEACQNTPDNYPCTVMIYRDRRHLGGGEALRIIDRAEIGHDAEGRRTADIRLTADTIRIEALRIFAAGKDRPREIPAELVADVRALDAAPTRRVKKIVPAWQPTTQAA
ncbi:hypothetical protein ASH00_09065 [Arthrobacter sp. Soil782]|uniref:competence protein CoiA family protein n=1 Tax=Arthrobacter sp. Soil782 TaxID=1736410 RepID=UPI0006F592DB|nr:hypothetical protein [Arthrobacter sp. Soil782]KRF05607.1 hypothetical protein ASH00_09065 [Arthrobacter sp. Soil782]